MDINRIAGLETLWAETSGDPRICIALLDGPTDCSHPVLIGAHLGVAKTGNPCLNRGVAIRHGTRVASIIFGQHTTPIKGIAPSCRGLIVPIMGDSFNGLPTSYSQLGLAQAMMLAVQFGAQIINISLGQISSTGMAHPLLAQAVSYCEARGILVVTAAGNEGGNTLSIPAVLPLVLAVGAMDDSGLPLQFSNWGEQYQTHGILAPGRHIPVASFDSNASTDTGTSYATPIVSGVAALLASLQLKYGLRPNLHAIREALLQSAVGCNVNPVPDCRQLLAGRLNIEGARSLLFKGVETMPHPNQTQETEPFIPAMVYSQKPLEGMPKFEGQMKSASQAFPYSEDTLDRSTQNSSYPIANPNSSNCGCNCGSNELNQLVFALGKLGFDFGTEARRDSIGQYMELPDRNTQPNPYDPNQLLNYLKANPWDATAIIWTLNLDATPIYAIKPCGPFASEIYSRLQKFIAEQIENDVERVSIPGKIVGGTRLASGQIVPVVEPELRGMHSWRTESLIEAVCERSEKENHESCKERVGNFFIRVYEELRNLGITPQDRALNYAATNALLVAQIFKDAIKENLVLGYYAIEQSPICRPESNCWDIKLTFFDPNKLFEKASKVYLLTIDVSDTVPVMVGTVRSWFVHVRP